MKPVLYMAPIMGVTGCAYRNIYSRFFEGYDIAVLPFINNNKGRKSSLKDVLPERNNVNYELVPQILEKNPENFILLARKLYDLGYGTVNWNLGCPLPMVRKKKKGAGLLSYPGEIVKFLNEVIPQIPNQLSIKVRLGSEYPDELPALLPLLENIPIKEIIVHPRTGKQMYKGTPDLDAFGELISLTSHDLVYSGNINSLKDYEELQKRFPTIIRWMIGRRGITNPFLPEEIKTHTKKNAHKKINTFLAFHEALLEEYKKELSGPAHLIGKMKEAWRYWAPAFEKGNRLFLDLSRTKSVEAYSAVIERFFQDDVTSGWN